MFIKIELLRKSFGEVEALKSTSLEIGKGEFISLLGPSGCGKTTLLNLLAGLEKPDDGKIIIADKVVYDKSAKLEVPAEKRNIGMVFQDFALWPHMTVFENVAFGLRARKINTNLKDKVEWALAKVRLSGYNNRYPHELSGGQQQRVSFARAIATEPELILLDEPLSALDAILREELRIELLSTVKELNLTAVYVTHDQSEAMSMSDRVFVMMDGEIVQKGLPEELYNEPKHPFVANFIGKINIVSFGDSSEMFIIRPEHLFLVKQNEDNISYKCIVDQVLYLGDRYEVILKQKDTVWTAYFLNKPNIGDIVDIYISRKNIRKVL